MLVPFPERQVVTGRGRQDGFLFRSAGQADEGARAARNAVRLVGEHSTTKPAQFFGRFRIRRENFGGAEFRFERLVPGIGAFSARLGLRCALLLSAGATGRQCRQSVTGCVEVDKGRVNGFSAAMETAPSFGTTTFSPQASTLPSRTSSVAPSKWVL